MTSMEVLPVRVTVVDLALVAEIGVFEDEFLVAKVIEGGVAASADEIVSVRAAAAGWLDCCAREEAGGQREAACRNSSHRDRRQNRLSVGIVAPELIEMSIDWVHPGCGLDLKEMDEISICIGGVDGVINEYEPEFEFGGIRGELFPGDCELAGV